MQVTSIDMLVMEFVEYNGIVIYFGLYKLKIFTFCQVIPSSTEFDALHRSTAAQIGLQTERSCLRSICQPT